ncbi:MAG: PKD domain-containing protein [bacterium]
MLRLRHPSLVFLQAFSLFLLLFLLGCGGGNDTTAPPPGPDPDPDTNGGTPGPDPDDDGGGGGGGGGGTTANDYRSGTTDASGVVILPGFAKSPADSKGRKGIQYQVLDANGDPLAGALVINVRSGGEFVGAIIPPDGNFAPKLFFSKRIPDRLGTVEEDHAAASINPVSFGPLASSALNIALNGDTFVVKLNLNEDATIEAATGLTSSRQHFIDDELLDRVLSFGTLASVRGVFSAAELTGEVKTALTGEGGYVYVAGLVEDGSLLTNHRLATAYGSSPNDATYKHFLDPLTGGTGATSTYFVQQLEVTAAADPTGIQIRFDQVFNSNPIPTNLGPDQRYMLVTLDLAKNEPAFTGDTSKLLYIVPVAPRAVSVATTDGDGKFALGVPEGLTVAADYHAGSAIPLAEHPIVTTGLNNRIALTMSPFRPGDALSRTGAAPSVTAVDELQRTIQAAVFIPDYFPDPQTIPQTPVGFSCVNCAKSDTTAVVGPNGTVTNLKPHAALRLVDPIGGSGRMVNGLLHVNVDGTGTTDADGNIAQIDIDWGDNTPHTIVTNSGGPISFATNFPHDYAIAGTFTIRLTATDDGDGPQSDSATVNVTAIQNANPVACATFDPAPVDTPIPISSTPITGFAPFTVLVDFGCSSDADSNLDLAGKLTVHFGDGVNLVDVKYSDFKSFSKLFATPGHFTVEITITDVDGGSNTVTQVVDVSEVPPNNPPVPVIMVDQSSGEAPLTVHFDGSGSHDDDAGQTIITYLWNFGDPAISDGGTASGVTADHTYTVADTGGLGFTSTLTVIDSSGVGPPNDRATAEQIINVSEPSNLPPTVIVDSPPVVEVNQPVNFSSSQSVDPDGNNFVTYAWDFGDGIGTSTEANPTYTYTTVPKKGFYSISLSITDDGVPPKTGIGAAAIQVTAPFDATLPYAIIVPQDPTSDIAPLEVTFDGSGSYSPIGTNIVDWAWIFSDGGNDTGSNVTYTFANPGNYTVFLTVTDDSVPAKTALTAIPVYVGLTPPIGQGQLVFARATALPGEVTLGDPITFSSLGTHDPEGGAWQVISWNFGDGSPNVTDLNPDHTYAALGTYQVVLTVTEQMIPPDPLRFTQTTLPVRVVTSTVVNEPPVVLAAADDYFTGDAPQTINFAALFGTDTDGTLTEASYLWDFGDGNNGLGSTPSHQYDANGIYNVRLTCTDEGGAPVVSRLLLAVGTPLVHLPLIDIQIPSNRLVFTTTQSLDLDFTLSVETNGEALTFDTDWGDSTAHDAGSSPSHLYLLPGRYTVTVTATNESLGIGTRQFQVIVL